MFLAFLLIPRLIEVGYSSTGVTRTQRFSTGRLASDLRNQTESKYCLVYNIINLFKCK